MNNEFYEKITHVHGDTSRMRHGEKSNEEKIHNLTLNPPLVEPKIQILIHKLNGGIFFFDARNQTVLRRACLLLNM